MWCLTHARVQFAQLHPVVLSAHERERGEQQHSDTLDALMADFAGRTRDEVLRVLLAVQFNSFASGLYLDQGT